jgi:protein TonB
MDRTAPAVNAAAPAVNATPTPGAETTLAIVGLNPANTRVEPPPLASRPAGFSAGPVENKDGSHGGTNGTTLLNVPGLTVRGGAKDNQPTMMAPPFSPTSRENLLAAARSPGGAPSISRSGSETNAPPMPAPDPRLAGRVIYSIAIQMPNVTSYSGSWQVWFAEREPLPGSPQVDMRAPVPLHKVDPKYVAAAAAERIEGIIRLAALIRKDGHVEQISLLRHLDVRLDRTAQEALAKWEFTPAMRNGVAVDVDAVFEIPFRLAPQPGRR